MDTRLMTKLSLGACLVVGILAASGCAGEPAYEALSRPAQAADAVGNAVLADAQYDPDTARFIADWDSYSVYLATKTDDAGKTSPCIVVLEQPLTTSNWAGACGDATGPVTLGFDGHVFRIATEGANPSETGWTKLDTNVYVR
ncbi:hypothetical protein [Lysinibacter cavernae]|uniref:Lipoprotein n=1 Tax=Lysinibacter cavernae TaxID=1640652 RepID=A0A7X5QYY5_9MICO|nr:hypothetical protein [Lysinibacter cavernae]NIH52589.1 hypothetical protein [Lysinibacter cavernae]